MIMNNDYYDKYHEHYSDSDCHRRCMDVDGIVDVADLCSKHPPVR